MACIDAAVGKSYFLVFTEDFEVVGGCESLEHTDGAPVEDVELEQSELNCDNAARFNVLDVDVETLEVV